jgi:hypothetical protein
MTAPALNPDDLLVSELEEARAEIEQVEAENEALRLRIGEPGAASNPRVSPARRDREVAAAYRAEDRGVRLERELGEANTALADLHIENAILKTRAEPVKSRNGLTMRRFFLALALVLGTAFLWFLTESLGMMLFAAILALVSWGVVVLIDRIRPGGNSNLPPLN